MRRQPTCCHSFLAFLLKFLNYLQTFVGVSIVIYSAFMLNHWHKHGNVPSSPPPQPHPEAPSPLYFSSSSSYNRQPKVKTFDDITPLNLDLDLNLNLAVDVVVSNMAVIDGVQLNIHSLPAPWFIYSFMGVGVMLCCVACIGQIAAEAINGCCLCFYATLTTCFVLVEITSVIFIAINCQQEKCLPTDSTGELERLRFFFEENKDVCEGVCIAVIIVQVLSLLLSIVLRAVVNQKVDIENDGAHDIRERSWEPLLHSHLSEASGSIRSDGRGTHSDIWRSRMREKYGLNGGDSREHLMNHNASVNQHHPGH